MGSQVTTAVREIAPEDYDSALRAAPGACPLLCVAGDRRGGAELLAGLEGDRRAAARLAARGRPMATGSLWNAHGAGAGLA